MFTLKNTLLAIFLFSFTSLYAQPVEYKVTSPYNKGELVIVNSSDTYIALQPVPVGKSPPDSTYWVALADEAKLQVISSDELAKLPSTDVADILKTKPESPPTDSSGGGSNTNLDPLASGLLSSTNEAFIRQQYVDFFGRKADTAGIDYYNEKFNGGYTKAELVNEFVFSIEFQEKIAPVSRLYLAYFLRIPDTAGLEYWINQKLNGWSLEVISSAFADSDEFKGKYGTLNNADFIRLVYQNIFNRTADT
ncbi:MAG: DUF4214 domain-containing protein, partial [Opitutae bacterium]|nr:DUF4214 domain-containing protein [Opitutae bacterium]